MKRMALTLTILFTAKISLATSVVLMPFETLVARSDTVVHGIVRFLDKKQPLAEDDTYRTIVQLEVIEGIKGLGPNEKILEIPVPGGYLDDGRRLQVIGMPQFRVGDEVVLLLQAMAYGYAPIGFAQGVFYVDRKSQAPQAKRLIGGGHYIQNKKLLTAKIAPENNLPRLLEQLRTLTRRYPTRQVTP